MVVDLALGVLAAILANIVTVLAFIVGFGGVFLLTQLKPPAILAEPLARVHWAAALAATNGLRLVEGAGREWRIELLEDDAGPDANRYRMMGGPVGIDYDRDAERLPDHVRDLDDGELPPSVKSGLTIREMQQAVDADDDLREAVADGGEVVADGAGRITADVAAASEGGLLDTIPADIERGGVATFFDPSDSGERVVNLADKLAEQADAAGLLLPTDAVDRAWTEYGGGTGGMLEGKYQILAFLVCLLLGVGTGVLLLF